jgi:HPt (histidine-containing phosphotransfer) domain-containing protein
LIADLETAIHGGDAPAMMKAAHSVKGNATPFCAKPVYDQAALLEAKGYSGDLDGVTQDFEKIQSQLHTLRHALVVFAETTPDASPSVSSIEA